MCNDKACYLFLTLSLLLLTFCGASNARAVMRLRSPAFAPNAPIPVEFTCSGAGESPALAWTGVPVSAKSLALIISDPDAPSGNFIHWVIFNIPPTMTALPEGVGAAAKTRFGTIQGQNGRGDAGYTGPCPPPGKDHHYHFRLYALDQALRLTSDADARQAEAAMRGHVVGEAELIGIFAR
jgi:Raf kinase inhibitor-like YbhB/YbcL family protein